MNRNSGFCYAQFLKIMPLYKIRLGMYVDLFILPLKDSKKVARVVTDNTFFTTVWPCSSVYCSSVTVSGGMSGILSACMTKNKI